MAFTEKCEVIEENAIKTEEYFSSDSSTNFDCHLSTIEEKLSDLPDVWEYIITLRNLIAKQRKKLRKLRRKLQRREAPRDTNDASTQTESSEVDTSKSITEEITEAAESALHKQGFVYEETSGLYYDYNSGYYYNAQYGLYYDGNTGTYMSYDPEKQEYVFHSQVEIKAPLAESVSDEKNNRGKSQDRKRKRSECADNVDLEEGECSDESCRVSECESENSDDDKNSESSNQWPPCIRIIVEETSTTIKPGSLFVITCEGGTLGREGKHDILLPDINVSKHHLQFKCDKDTGSYYVTDLGSRNGTLLNGKRMASSKQESEPIEIIHGTRIQIGTTILLCHIHTGSQTCGLCEPGLLQHKTATECLPSIKSDKNVEHKHQLKKLKQKFAIAHVDSGGLAPGYTDRAQTRRETIGSQNEHEKTQVASLEQSISSENKGFKLLAKMGWSEGQSLGKEGTGRLEPVALVANHGTSGIGNKEIVPHTLKNNKSDVWTKAKERYDQLPPQNTDDDNDNDF